MITYKAGMSLGNLYNNFMFNIPLEVHQEFKSRIKDWIENERSFLEHWKRGDIASNGEEYSLDHILHRINFNVMDAYDDLIRSPDPCPECTRTGGDHDGECPIGSI